MKILIGILLLVLSYTYVRGQQTSPGLDALLLNSEIIVQGICYDKYCKPEMDVMSLMMDICVISLVDIKVLKGNPKLSIVEIKEVGIRTPAGLIPTMDTTEALCFTHIRDKGRHHLESIDSLSYKDYNVNMGDAVLVFLNGYSEIKGPPPRLGLDQRWDVYTLTDPYLGVITANDFVTEYLVSKIKKPAIKQR